MFIKFRSEGLRRLAIVLGVLALVPWFAFGLFIEVPSFFGPYSAGRSVLDIIPFLIAMPVCYFTPVLIVKAIDRMKAGAGGESNL